MRRLRLELSPSSVRSAARELERYRQGLPAKVEEVLRRVCELGVVAAATVVPTDTGELRSSIRVERLDGRDYLVVTDCGYAAFVEFGTGVVGQGTYGGELPAGWGYDERRTPEAHDERDPTRWYYYDRDGTLCSTRGRTASGFMLAASEEMRRSVLGVAREVFST